MRNKVLSIEQKKIQSDLWTIALISFAALAIYMLLQNRIVVLIKGGSINILLRVLIGAVFQFGLAGLGISVVLIYRKESFLDYGLNKKGWIKSIAFCFICFVPHIIFMQLTNQITGYLPFQSVWTTKDVLSGNFPVNIIGMLITGAVWGFFEGFNYVVISDKINSLYSSTNKWLNWGAIICSVMCILIHGVIGITLESIIEMITVFTAIYGMLMVKQFTGNAWGCVFVFIFLWNAF